MNTKPRKVSMPINQWITLAGQISILAEKVKLEGVAQTVSGGAGIAMLQAARQATNTKKDLLAAIDKRFEDLGRAEMVDMQQMAREELLELGVPTDNEMPDHAQLREDTEKLLMDISRKIQEISRVSLEFEVPGWIADELIPNT